MGAVKHSRQRDAIKTFLMSRKDHPTADVVYTFVKNDFPSISLGTVYCVKNVLRKINVFTSQQNKK